MGTMPRVIRPKKPKKPIKPSLDKINILFWKQKVITMTCTAYSPGKVSDLLKQLPIADYDACTIVNCSNNYGKLSLTIRYIDRNDPRIAAQLEKANNKYAEDTAEYKSKLVKYVDDLSKYREYERSKILAEVDRM